MVVRVRVSPKAPKACFKHSDTLRKHPYKASIKAKLHYEALRYTPLASCENTYRITTCSIRANFSYTHRGIYTMKLSDTSIRNSKPTKSQYSISDGNGLSMLIMPTGGKLWRFRYRWDGKENLLSLGKYPDVSLAKARERCLAAREQLADGTNPSDTRKEAKAADVTRKANTFGVWAKRWHEHWKQGVEAYTAQSRWRRLELDILPVMGDMPVATVNSGHIVAILKSVADRGALDLAGRLYQIINQVFRHAIAHTTDSGISINPAAQFQPRDVIPARHVSNMARVETKDVGELLRSIDMSPANPKTRIALRLMAYTFVRPSELIEASWAEFDLDGALWTIPKERMKMRTPHIVPLSRQAVECLHELRNHTGMGALLFPNRNDATRPASNNLILKALAAIGYKGKQTGHGFRGIASTALRGVGFEIAGNEYGFDRAHIEAQLAHQSGDKTERAYNHADYLPQRTKMMQKWADWLDQQKRGGEVIPFVGRK